ncbi:MAG: TIR domain-containing protein [Planctomycetota bacterium]
MRTFDVFLSHNSKDKLLVRRLAQMLKEQGISVWLDEWELVPGRPWQEALEEIIQTTKSVAVLLGPNGLGPWEIPEMRACLSEFVSRQLPVIPVLLPGIERPPDLPLFLKQFTWVDFRDESSFEANVEILIWGITGEKPRTLSAEAPKRCNLITSPKNIQFGGDANLPIFVGLARRHCENYKSLLADLSSFDGEECLPRDVCGISRHTSDLESDRQERWSRSSIVTQLLVHEDDLIEQLASRSRRRLWVLGSGGIGKTEFSRMIALRLAQRFCEEPETGIVPILIDLKSLDPSAACNSPDRLLKNHLVQDDFQWVRSYMAASRVAFILDGLDELRLDRQSFNDALVKLIHQWRACVFVVTSRGDSIEPGLTQTYCFVQESVHILKPITLEEAKAYVTAFFRCNKCDGRETLLLRLLEDNPIIREMLCTSPLLLAMASRVYLANEKITSNPLDLLERGLSVVFERRRSKYGEIAQEPPEDTTCFSVISCLAANAIIGYDGEEKISLKFSRQDAIAWLRANSAELELAGIVIDSDDAARRLILQLIPGSGVLAWASRDTITFSHRVLAEFFAARWIVEAGYPRWPYHEDDYTQLHDVQNRQIADFFGDHYWPLEFHGIRYWMFYLLERRRPDLFVALIQWQRCSLTRLANSIPPSIAIASDAFIIANRLLRSIQKLRNIKSDALADEIFDELVDEIGLETIAKLTSPPIILQVCSHRHLQTTLRFFYSGSQYQRHSEIAYRIMPLMLQTYYGRLDKCGKLIGVKDAWNIALDYSYYLLQAKYEGTLAWGLNLSSLQNRFQLSEEDKRVLIECMEDSFCPTRGMPLWDILSFLLVKPLKDFDFLSLLRSLLENIGTDDKPEQSFVEAAMLLHSESDSELSFVATVTEIFFHRMRDNCPQRLGYSLSKFLCIRQPNTALLEKLCYIPERLMEEGRISDTIGSELARVIANCISDSTWIEDSIAENILADLYDKCNCKKAVLGRATCFKSSSVLFEIARDLATQSLYEEFWQSEETTMLRLDWLRSLDFERFREIRDRTIQHAECTLSEGADKIAGELAVLILRAKKVRQMIEFPLSSLSLAVDVLMKAIKEFGSELTNTDIWNGFSRHTASWRLDMELLCRLSMFKDPFDHKQEAQFLILILSWARVQQNDLGELPDIVIERLCEVGLEEDLNWIESEPVSEILRRFVLLAIRFRTGGPLIDAHKVIRLAASRWGDDTETRYACIDLVTQSVRSATHSSVLEAAGQALLESWPGDYDVLRDIVQAGLGSIVIQSDSWSRWMILWESERTTWLPDCTSGFQRIPINLKSGNSGHLILFLREDVRCGLPGELASSAWKSTIARRKESHRS